MGKNKALLPFSSSPTLSEYQYKRWEPYFSKVYISCKDKNIFDFKANFIEDIYHEESSPILGLYSMFKQTEEKVVAVISVDTPFVSIENYKILLNHLYHEDAVIPDYHPLCGVYKRDILPSLKELLDEKKYSFKHLFEKIRIKYIEVKNENDFINLNFPKDYKEAIERIQDEKYFN